MENEYDVLNNRTSSSSTVIGAYVGQVKMIEVAFLAEVRRHNDYSSRQSSFVQRKACRTSRLTNNIARVDQIKMNSPTALNTSKFMRYAYDHEPLKQFLRNNFFPHQTPLQHFQNLRTVG